MHPYYDDLEDLDIYPDRRKDGFLEDLRQTIMYWMMNYRDWRCRRCHAYLLKNDFKYKFEQVGKELVKARSEARAKGIGPMDPNYPDIKIGNVETLDKWRRRA
jgi:hypothetical protein